MSNKLTKPMLATAVKDLSKIRFPCIVSPKYDGVRALLIDGKLVSRSLKPIQNRYIRETLERILPEGADGEIMIGENFQQVASGVMRWDGEPKFVYWMFDLAPEGAESYLYETRLDFMISWCSRNPHHCVRLVPTQVLHNVKDLDDYLAKCLAEGYEGAMIRDPYGKYKCGRSTLKEGGLLKIKPFSDSEAEILGFEEQMENTNPKELNELGQTKRSTHKANKVGKGTLGRFLVRDVHSGVVFKIGTGQGLTAALRQEIWNAPAFRTIGRIIKYKYQAHGVKNKPRTPIFLGFRSLEDMS